MALLFPVQIQRPLPVIEHLVVVVGGNPDSVSFFEEPTSGNVQVHHVLLSCGRWLVELPPFRGLEERIKILFAII